MAIKEKVSKYSVVLKVDEQMETYRVDKNLFKSIKKTITPYRSIGVTARAIKCLDTGETFRCAREVMYWLQKQGLTSSYSADAIVKRACKKNKPAYGLNWQFLN